MRRSRKLDLRRWARPGWALLVALLALSACATRGQVEAIVAESNAALVSPYVDIAGEGGGDWEESVRDIDRFIDAHADNPTLVNHLRVRQAMLLTANGKRNLADQYWDLVQRDALSSERDRSLKDVGKHLSWWYQTAPDPAYLEPADAAAARTAFSTALESTTEGTDIRIYLSTIRAQLEVRMARDSQLKPPQAELPASLERYIDAIGADQGWITTLEGLEEQDLASARAIKAFRYRIWLRELIGAYKRVAEDLELSMDEVDWAPDWVDGIR
jgi:hypothetical protein